MKKSLLILCLIFVFSVKAQQENSGKMRQVSLNELKMKYYNRDSTAGALVLDESINRYNTKSSSNFFNDYYSRIKIFNQEFVDLATIEIVLYKEEEVKNIEAISYNLKTNGYVEKKILSKKDIFIKDINENFKTYSFTLPNVKKGTVIEYKYQIISPYTSFDDWYFQSSIPKIKSTYNSSILINYRYRQRLTGYLKVNKLKDYIDDACYYIKNGYPRSCQVLSLSMNLIPAFKEEDFMTSKDNFISKLSFDLQSIYRNVGGEKQFTTTWDNADKTLKKEFLNKQGNKSSLFKKIVPQSFFNIPNKLEQAKKTVAFIKDRFTWNNKYWFTRDINIRKAFEKKTGSVQDINLSLYNSLKTLGIEAYIVLVSTRENGIPVKIYPVITDFNYIVVKAVINGQEYFLDATDKNLPFGLVPFKTLNGDARVLDFDKGSYWQKINTNSINSKKINSLLKFNSEGNLIGQFTNTYSGYHAYNLRSEYNLIGKESYLENLETKLIDFEIDDFKINHLNDLEKPINETFTLISDDPLTTQKKISLKPILLLRSSINPFKLKERLYPVDFGHTSSIVQRINIEIPEGYTVSKLPREMSIKLPNNGGLYLYKLQQKDNKIKIYSKYIISKKVFKSDEYVGLKEFFNKMITIENLEIILQKI